MDSRELNNIYNEACFGVCYTLLTAVDQLHKLSNINVTRKSAGFCCGRYVWAVVLIVLFVVYLMAYETLEEKLEFHVKNARLTVKTLYVYIVVDV